MMDIDGLLIATGVGIIAVSGILGMVAYLNRPRDGWIACPFCRKSIKPGDPIALYPVINEDDDDRRGTCYTDPNGRIYVIGCVRPKCTSPDAYSGTWTKEGVLEVER